MTNGEMIQKVFDCEVCVPIPEDDIIHVVFLDKNDSAIAFDWSWWSMKYKEPTTKNDLGVDCISRAYLYNRIKGIDHDEDYECDEYGGSRITYHTCDWDEVLREIEDAPSVTLQEPRKGHWIRVAGGSLIDDYRCDCCNHQPPIRKVGSTWGWDFTDYCPNCGAKMESEVEE